MPAWAVGISLFASLLSTITYLGMPGEMFRTGLSFLTRQIPIPLVLVVVWCLWIPFFMRLRLTSAYEYIERRFDYPTRALAAAFCLLLLFGWISVVVLTASQAMAEITVLNLPWFFGSNGEFRDADMHFIILAIGLFSVLYTTLGGMRAVIWTDVIQFVVLMIGALFTMGAVAWMTDSGIMDWVRTSQRFQHEQVEWFDWDVRNRSTVFSVAIGMFFWFTCTHGSNQVALQRYFAVKDMSAARRTYLVSAVASLLIGVILAGVGISLMHFVEHYDHALDSAKNLTHVSDEVRNQAQDNIFPQFIRTHLLSGMRGMVVAALFAAAMSTIDSGSNSASTILTVDFFRRLGRTPISEKRELRRARMLTATMGLIVVFYSIAIYHLSKGSDIISLCQRGFNCFLGPLGALFFIGMFSRTATSRSVLPAFLIGEIVGVCTSYSIDLFGVHFSTHLVVPASWCTTIVICGVLSTVLRLQGIRATPEQQQWTWPAVTRNLSPTTATETASAEPARDSRVESGDDGTRD
jgi:SSS family solute:Na+ symporter